LTGLRIGEHIYGANLANERRESSLAGGGDTTIIHRGSTSEEYWKDRKERARWKATVCGKVIAKGVPFQAIKLMCLNSLLRG
jgi:hypothetical protein